MARAHGCRGQGPGPWGKQAVVIMTFPPVRYWFQLYTMYKRADFAHCVLCSVQQTAMLENVKGPAFSILHCEAIIEAIRVYM